MAKLNTTLGQLLVNSLLPPEFQDYARQIDKNSLNELLSRIALEKPELYRDISHRLSQTGIKVATRTGGFSFGPQHLRMSNVALKNRIRLQSELDQLLDDETIDPKTRNARVIAMAQRYQKGEPKQGDDVSLAEQNPLALQILSGSRGNPGNLASLRASPLLFADARDEPVPIAIMRSYSQGLRPSEYFGASYGGRRSVMTTKLGIAQSGYMGKQLVQAAHRLLVSGHDGKHDPNGPIRGFPVDVDDTDNEGSLLAQPVGGYPRNTILSPRILKDMQKQGVKRILVRSPTVGGPDDGGVYARDVGIREFGRLPTRYEQVGISAAQALGERLCAAAGTRVRMANGKTKRIEKIKPGDMVLGCSRDGIVRPTEVLALWDNGERACVRTVFRNGTGKAANEALLTLDATPDHRILSEIVIRGSNNGRDNPDTRERRFKTYWNPVDVRPLNTPMKHYDRFCAKLSESFDDTDLRHEPLAMLVGVLVGDGCYTGCSTSITFRCFDPEQAVDMTNIYAKKGYNFTLNTANEGTYTVSDERRKHKPTYREDGSYYRNRVKEWLRKRGMWGKYSYEKELPPDIHSWDNASVAAFVSGYLAADGWISKSNKTSVVLGFGSTSKKLLRQLRVLLEVRFGVRSMPISQSTKKGTQVDGEPYRPCYKFAVATLDSLQRLHAVLKIPGVKQRRFDRRMRHRNANSRSNASRRAVRVSTESIGMKHTYDLYVAHPDHLFVLANGLVIHNSQIALSSKHSGGVAGGNKLLSGMPLFQALINTPKTVKGGAAHATVDGKVSKVEPGPAGGQFVWVDDKKHFVNSGFEVRVKPGDEIEAGDVLSEGIPNPAMVVQYKGVGEGRRYFTKLFSDSLKQAGIYSHRRNVELLARGLINHVELQDEVGEGVPGDIMPYQTLESTWQPRDGFKRMNVAQARGKYLESPILHYSIGTPIRPSVQRDLEEFGVRDIDVHDDPPPFQATMVRADTQLQHDPDVLTKMYGSHIRKSFLSAVHRGGSSDRDGTSFVPGLAFGVGFGLQGKVQTPKQAPPHPGWASGEPKQTELDDLHPTAKLPKIKTAWVDMPPCPECGSDDVEAKYATDDGHRCYCEECGHTFLSRDVEKAASKAAARICPECPKCPECGADETVHEDGKILCYACEHRFKAAAKKPTLAVTYDRPKGTKKIFNTPDGKREVTYPVDYGFFDDIFNPEDGEEADVFVGTGDLCGRFMKGNNLDGEWKPDEKKWYVGLSASEFAAVMDMYRNKADKDTLPDLVRDHIRFDDVTKLEADVKLLPQRGLGKAAGLQEILPIIAMMGMAGLSNMPALLQFFGLKNMFGGKAQAPQQPNGGLPPVPTPAEAAKPQPELTPQQIYDQAVQDPAVQAYHQAHGELPPRVGEQVSAAQRAAQRAAEDGVFSRIGRSIRGGVGAVGGAVGSLATLVPGNMAWMAQKGVDLVAPKGTADSLRPWTDTVRNVNKEMLGATGAGLQQAVTGNHAFNDRWQKNVDTAANMADRHVFPRANIVERAIPTIAQRAMDTSDAATYGAMAAGATPYLAGGAARVAPALARTMPAWAAIPSSVPFVGGASASGAVAAAPQMISGLGGMISNPAFIATSAVSPTRDVLGNIPGLSNYLSPEAFRQQGDYWRDMGENMGVPALGNAAGMINEHYAPMALDIGMLGGANRALKPSTGWLGRSLANGTGYIASQSGPAFSTGTAATFGLVGAATGRPEPLPNQPAAPAAPQQSFGNHMLNQTANRIGPLKPPAGPPANPSTNFGHIAKPLNPTAPLTNARKMIPGGGF